MQYRFFPLSLLPLKNWGTREPLARALIAVFLPRVPRVSKGWMNFMQWLNIPLISFLLQIDSALGLEDITICKGVLNEAEIFQSISQRHLSTSCVCAHANKQAHAWIFLYCPFPKSHICPERNLLCYGEKIPVLHSSSWQITLYRLTGCMVFQSLSCRALITE